MHRGLFVGSEFDKTATVNRKSYTCVYIYIYVYICEYMYVYRLLQITVQATFK